MTAQTEDYHRGLAQMLDALRERVVRYRKASQEVLYCNPAWATSHGAQPAELIGRSLRDLLAPEELAGLTQQLARLGPDHPQLLDDVPRPAPDVPGRWIAWSDQYIDGDVLAVGRDVTDRHLAEVALTRSENRFRELAERSADVVWRFSLAPCPHFNYLSPSVEAMTGYSVAELQDDFDTFLSMTDETGRALMTAALKGRALPERYDLHLTRKDGGTVIGEMQITRLPDGLQGVARDVTQVRALQRELVSLALRDPLTGLANRRLLDELLGAALSRTERSGMPLTVTYLDLDHFKTVNDTYGHDAGDRVLRETARRLQVAARSCDVVARVGGDEFVIVHEAHHGGVQVLIDRLGRALMAPIDLGDRTKVRCSASIGSADTGTAGRDPAALLAAADDAMFAAKRAGRLARI